MPSDRLPRVGLAPSTQVIEHRDEQAGTTTRIELDRAQGVARVSTTFDRPLETLVYRIEGGTPGRSLHMTNPALLDLAARLEACERHWPVVVVLSADSVRITKPDVPGGWDFEAHVCRSGRIAWRLLWCDDEIVTGSAFDVDGVLQGMAAP